MEASPTAISPAISYLTLPIILNFLNPSFNNHLIDTTKMLLTTAITLFATLQTIRASAVLSKRGINCEGSSQCSQGTGGVSRKLSGYINEMNDGTWVNNGVQIACVREPHSGGEAGAICAFMYEF